MSDISLQPVASAGWMRAAGGSGPGEGQWRDPKVMAAGRSKEEQGGAGRSREEQGGAGRSRE